MCQNPDQEHKFFKELVDKHLDTLLNLIEYAQD